MSQTFGFALRIHFVIRDEVPAAPLQLPPNSWWRRTLGGLFANRTNDRNRSMPVFNRHRTVPAATPSCFAIVSADRPSR